MINADIDMKVGDRRPVLDATLKDANGAVDLTGTTARFLMIDELDDSNVIDQTSTGSLVTFVDTTGGKVRYAWALADTSTAGHFRAEWEVTFADGTKVTFPNADYISVLIREDVD